MTHLPLKRGKTFQTEIGPRDENCPTAISRKNSGRPAMTNIMTYGIRKLAEILHKSHVQNIYLLTNIYYLSHCYSIAWGRWWNHFRLSVSQCVSRRSYGCNFYSIFMKFCTVVRGPKSKIEFVWDENSMTPSPILRQFYPHNAFSVKVLISQSKETREPIIIAQKTSLGGCYRRKPEKYFTP